MLNLLVEGLQDCFTIHGAPLLCWTRRSSLQDLRVQKIAAASWRAAWLRGAPDPDFGSTLRLEFKCALAR